VGLDDSSLELQVSCEELASLLTTSDSFGSFFPRADPNKYHYLPVNLHRIIQTHLDLPHLIDESLATSNRLTSLTPSRATRRLIIVRGNDRRSGGPGPTRPLTFRCIYGPHLPHVASWKITSHREAFDGFRKVEAKF